MLKMTLGKKAYELEYVRAAALREIGEPMQALKKLEEGVKPEEYRELLDVLVNWFCLLFGNQFSPAEVYEKYPADRLEHDLALAVLAVQNHVSQALRAFPTMPAAEEQKAAE